jgi:hypothetical protein
VSYLENLKIDNLSKNYGKVLQFDSDRPFPHNFTQEDRDTFYRMKFKALNQKIVSGGVGDGQQMFA